MTARSDVRATYYNARPREARAVVAQPEVREATDGSFTICGYASVTDAPYEVNDWLGAYSETIERGAFAKSLREIDDVRLLVNHDGIPLARTRSGTLTLREITSPEDDPQGRAQTGLWCEANIDGASPVAQSVRSAMSRGDMNEMSFAFQATRQEWNEDYSERTVREVRLFDVSVVTYPANPATSVQLNSERIAGIASRMASKRALTDPEDVAVITELLGVLASIDNVVDAQLDRVSDYLGVENPDMDEDMEPEDAEPEMGDRSRALALMNLRVKSPR